MCCARNYLAPLETGTSQPMSEEQRRDPRIATRQRIWCEGQDSPADAETRDVSQSGMFIVAERAPDVGSHFNVKFDDGTGEVSLKLEVMWKGPKNADNKTGMGVRIVGFDKGADVYERFLKRQAGDGAATPAQAAATDEPQNGTSG